MLCVQIIYYNADTTDEHRILDYLKYAECSKNTTYIYENFDANIIQVLYLLTLKVTSWYTLESILNNSN